MKCIAAALFSLITMCAFGQDTTYYSSEGKKVETIHEADYCEMVVFTASDSSAASLQQFFTNGVKKSEASYVDYKKDKKTGVNKSWYRNGELHTEIHYNNGKRDGKLSSWWENGKLKREDLYSNDSLISGKCYDSTGTAVAYYPYEVLPEFPGGETALIKYLGHELKYPVTARENGIQGSVYVYFFVDRNGNIVESGILDSPADDLSTEALRVVNRMPKWKPGLVDGEKTGTRYNLPIRFALR
ncbi:MAG TPA: TonB family protein [Bacteroidia bacterium]|nr:TonB family protein [Bacteroidia bacterium]